MGPATSAVVEGLQPISSAERGSPVGRLWASRGLVFTLVKRDIKVKYKESFLGFFWSFAKPLFLMLILGLVFGVVLDFKLNNTRVDYAVHLIVSLVPWMLLVNGLGDALHSVVANGNLIKKVKIQTEVFPLAAVLSNTIHFAISMAVLFLFLQGYGLWKGHGLLIDWPIILLPIALALQLTLMIGLALLLSSLNVFFRDVASIYEVLVAGLFYATPIIYDYRFFEEYLVRHPELAWTQWLYALNPMVGIMAAYRRALIYVGPLAQDAGIELGNTQLLIHMSISLAVSLVILVIGVRVFRRLSRTFADRV
jgi:ABC-2 type transport system permease protein